MGQGLPFVSKPALRKSTNTGAIELVAAWAHLRFLYSLRLALLATIIIYMIFIV